MSLYGIGLLENTRPGGEMWEKQKMPPAEADGILPFSGLKTFIA